MPDVFRWKGFRFFFFSNEGKPREACHIHVENADGEAKIWRDPQVRFASSAGLKSQDLLAILGVVGEVG